MLRRGCLVIACPHMQAKEPVFTPQQWELEGVKACTDSLASSSWMADNLQLEAGVLMLTCAWGQCSMLQREA